MEYSSAGCKGKDDAGTNLGMAYVDLPSFSYVLFNNSLLYK